MEKVEELYCVDAQHYHAEEVPAYGRYLFERLCGPEIRFKFKWILKIAFSR